MHELTDRELYQAIAFAKSLDEKHGKQIMEQLQLDQPGLYQTIFGIFPTIIAEHNQEMACLFMDLCFDVIFNTLSVIRRITAEIRFGWKNKQHCLTPSYNL
jgi:hypothetical protein